MTKSSESTADSALLIRKAAPRDLPQIVAIDALVTGIEKREYWREMLRRFARRDSRRQFLVAAGSAGVAGFAIGEVRDWEFGAPPCGWVFAIDVHPQLRLHGVGTRLLQAICDGFARAGVTRVRTLLDRDDPLVLSFFRSQGMMAAPLIPLEMELPAAAAEARRR
ncbi:MAG TPA: GNAT family N-acetyltransferase [Burkholderiaceae bacterium]|nr:GNAT family N-acetyltransferase [Burkholderiaceae bacterium]